MQISISGSLLPSNPDDHYYYSFRNVSCSGSQLTESCLVPIRAMGTAVYLDQTGSELGFSSCK